MRTALGMVITYDSITLHVNKLKWLKFNSNSTMMRGPVLEPTTIMVLETFITGVTGSKEHLDDQYQVSRYKIT